MYESGWSSEFRAAGGGHLNLKMVFKVAREGRQRLRREEVSTEKGSEG